MSGGEILEDVLAPGLRVVFCGTAPGHTSARQRRYYAHPQNKFWATLHAVGLTPVRLSPADYALVLRYGIGLTDIAKHVSGMDKDLPAGSLGRTAVEALEGRIAAFAPGILAFTSLTGASRFIGRPARFGEQRETIGATRIWALPSPSPAANWNWRIEPWRELALAAGMVARPGAAVAERRRPP